MLRTAIPTLLALLLASAPAAAKPVAKPEQTVEDAARAGDQLTKAIAGRLGLASIHYYKLLLPKLQVKTGSYEQPLDVATENLWRNAGRHIFDVDHASYTEDANTLSFRDARHLGDRVRTQRSVTFTPMKQSGTIEVSSQRRYESSTLKVDVTPDRTRFELSQKDSSHQRTDAIEIRALGGQKVVAPVTIDRTVQQRGGKARTRRTYGLKVRNAYLPVWRRTVRRK